MSTYKVHHIRSPRRKSGESLMSFAKRRYNAQRRWLSRLIKKPVDPWEALPQKIQAHWLHSTLTMEQEKAATKKGRSNGR